MGDWEKWERKDSDGNINIEYIRKSDVSNEEVNGPYIRDDQSYAPIDWGNVGKAFLISIGIILGVIALFASGLWGLGIIVSPFALGAIIGLLGNAG